MTKTERELTELFLNIELSYYSRKACGHIIGDREGYIRKTAKRMAAKADKYVKRVINGLRKSTKGFLKVWDSYVLTYIQAIRKITEVRDLSDRQRVRAIFKWVREHDGYAFMNAPVRGLNDEELALSKTSLFAVVTKGENDKFDKQGNVLDGRRFAINFFGTDHAKQIFKQVLIQYGFQFATPLESTWRDSVLILSSAKNNPNIADIAA